MLDGIREDELLSQLGNKSDSHLRNTVMITRIVLQKITKISRKKNPKKMNRLSTE